MTSELDWAGRLRAARQALKISQSALAQLAGVSAQTIKFYELGLRKPSRQHLTDILDALKLERVGRDSILLGAGFAPDGWTLGPDRYPEYQFTPLEAADHVELHPWPAFVLTELMEVVCANRVAQRLWDVDLRTEFTGPFGRSMLAIASNPRFADRAKNWDEMIKVAIGVYKGSHRGPEDLDTPSTAFSQVLATFLSGKPQYVSKLVQYWDSTPPVPFKVRFFYPVVWEAPGIGIMRFRSMVTPCNEPEGLAFNDWIPLDADTWTRLSALVAQPAGRSEGGS